MAQERIVHHFCSRWSLTYKDSASCFEPVTLRKTFFFWSSQSPRNSFSLKCQLHFLGWRDYVRYQGKHPKRKTRERVPESLTMPTPCGDTSRQMNKDRPATGSTAPLFPLASSSGCRTSPRASHEAIGHVLSYPLSDSSRFYGLETKIFLMIRALTCHAP